MNLIIIVIQFSSKESGFWLQQRVLNFAKYLERFRDALHYEKYRSLGLPIGSREIESAHRYIAQKRLKFPGATETRGK